MLSDYWHLKVDTQSKKVEAYQVHSGESDNKAIEALQKRAGAEMVVLPNVSFPLVLSASADDIDSPLMDILQLKDQRC